MPRKHNHSSGAKSAEPKPVPSRATVKTVNVALAERGYDAFLIRGGGDYFFFRGQGVNSWLDRTVQVPRVGDMTVKEWVQAFENLKKKNVEIERAGKRMVKHS